MTEHNNVKNFLPIEYKIGRITRTLRDELIKYNLSHAKKDPAVELAATHAREYIDDLWIHSPNSLDVPINTTEISNKQKKILLDAGYNTLRETIIAGKYKILHSKIPNRKICVGKKTVDALEAELEKYGLKLPK